MSVSVVSIPGGANVLIGGLAGGGDTDLTNVVFTTGDQNISGSLNIQDGSLSVSGDISFAGSLFHNSNEIFSVNDGLVSFSLGKTSSAAGMHSIALGFYSYAAGMYSIALGDNSSAAGTNSIALGVQASATGDYTCVIGSSSIPLNVGVNNSSPVYTLDVGGDINLTGNILYNGNIILSVNDIHKSVVLGLNATAGNLASNSMALGNNTSVGSSNSIVLGYNARVGTFSSNSIALGYNSLANAGNSISLGNNARALSPNSIALGMDSTASSSNTCVIGSNSSPLNVGVNNSSPVYTLDVNGSGNFSSGLSISGNNIATYFYSTNNPSGYITGVNLNNYVTLNTTQSISGLKTFNSGIVSSNVISPIIYSTGTGLTISGAGGVIGYDINIYGGRGGIGKGGDVNISGGSHGSNGSFGDASIFGNSINLSSYSDSYIKMTYGNFGIQTDSPQYTLDVGGDINLTGNILHNGNIILSVNENRYSLSLSDGAEEAGEFSTALGRYAIAQGNNSIALGAFTSAGISGSIAIGNYSNAAGIYSIAIGYGTFTDFDNACVIGSTSYPLNVGINQQCPSYTLDVNGNGNFSNGLYVNGVSGISLSINYMKTASTSGTLTFTNGLLTSST